MQDITERKRKEEKTYFTLFDVIRFAACMLVFLYHYDGLCDYHLKIDNNPAFDWIIRNGGEAIVLFFILSGFCMAHGYRDRISAGTVPVGAFAWKHYKKFLLMALITAPLTIVKAFYMYRAGLDTVPNLYGFLLDLFGIRTGYGLSGSFGYNAPLWFINVLFLMYMIYYLVCTACKTETSYRAVSLILMFFAMSQLAGQMLSFFILNKDTYIGLMGFFGGVLLYELYEYCEQDREACRKLSLLCSVLLITAVCACFLNTHWPGIGVLPEGEDLWVNTKLVLTIMVWAPLVFLTSQVKVRRERFFSKISGWLGKLAAFIYIWHWPVLYLFYCRIQLGLADWSLDSGRGILIVWGMTFLLALLTKYVLTYSRKMQKNLHRKAAAYSI